MRERRIKLALSRFWKERDPSADILAVDEINIGQGRTRADLVVVGDGFYGFEIKGPRDSLSRLSRQLEDYRSAFAEIHVVIGLKHLDGVLQEIPSWCGVLLLSEIGGLIEIDVFRASRKNYDQNRLALAQLLWRDEALSVLKKKGHSQGVLSKPRAVIWERLAERLSAPEISSEVQAAFRKRGKKWRDAL